MHIAARLRTRNIWPGIVIAFLLWMPAASHAGPFWDPVIELTSLYKPNLPLPGNLTIEKDIAYAPAPANRMDVYRAGKPAAALAPVIFVVHGGAWLAGDKAHRHEVQNKVAVWVPQGYVVISTNYRLSPEANPLEQARDVARALAFAQSNAASWGADPGKFVLIGHSSGAHLITLLTADPEMAIRLGAKMWLGAVALDSAGFNLVTTLQNPPYDFYRAVFRTDRQLWRDASPTLRLQKTSIPALLVCSTRWGDRCAGAREYAAKAAILGNPVSLLPVGFTHGNVNNLLGIAEGYTRRIEGFLESLGLP